MYQVGATLSHASGADSIDRFSAEDDALLAEEMDVSPLCLSRCLCVCVCLRLSFSLFLSLSLSPVPPRFLSLTLFLLLSLSVSHTHTHQVGAMVSQTSGADSTDKFSEDELAEESMEVSHRSPSSIVTISSSSSTAAFNPDTLAAGACQEKLLVS